MDLVDFDRQVFQDIVETYKEFASNLNFVSITEIPVSALKGDNVIERSSHTSWYSGPTLLGYLEAVEVGQSQIQHAFRFPVPLVRPSWPLSR